MKFYYKAVTKESKVIEGLVDAKDEKEAAKYLRSKDFLPIKIFRKGQDSLVENFPLIGKKVSSHEIVLFTRQLASMLTSGITLIRALEIIRNQVGNNAFKEMLSEIVSAIEEGSDLSTAISKYPKVFSPVYVALIKASEGSGLLDKACLRLADTLEKQQKLRGAIKSALTYPIIVILMMIAVIAIMMVFVIPQLSILYKNLNVPLPLPTLIVVAISNFVVSFWPFVFGGFGLIFFLFSRWRKTLEGKLMTDSFLLKIPIFGSLIKKTILAELTRTLGAMLASGTLVVDSLNQVADTAGNIHYQNAILDVAKRVEKGVTMGDAMSVYAIFPPSLVELVKIGEQSGKLDETLIKASEYFETEADQTIKTLTTALEPVFMIVLGLGVAFLVISIITPIYQITNSIK